jgi:hypothetical protein
MEGTRSKENRDEKSPQSQLLSLLRGYRTGLALLGVFFLNAMLGCGGKTVSESHSQSPYEKAVAQYKQTLLTNPEVQAAIAGRSPVEANKLLKNFVRQGWSRLSDERLLLRVAIRKKLLAATDITTCASIVRETATEAQTKKAFTKLAAAETEAFFALSTEAALAELKRQQKPRIVREEELPELFGALLSKLSEEQAERLATLLSRGPSQASDEDICWAERTFLETLSALNEPYRSTLARAVVQ